jgi:hypothetical protein
MTCHLNFKMVIASAIYCMGATPGLGIVAKKVSTFFLELNLVFRSADRDLLTDLCTLYTRLDTWSLKVSGYGVIIIMIIILNIVCHLDSIQNFVP